MFANSTFCGDLAAQIDGQAEQSSNGSWLSSATPRCRLHTQPCPNLDLTPAELRSDDETHASIHVFAGRCP